LAEAVDGMVGKNGEARNIESGFIAWPRWCGRSLTAFPSFLRSSNAASTEGAASHEFEAARTAEPRWVVRAAEEEGADGSDWGGRGRGANRALAARRRDSDTEGEMGSGVWLMDVPPEGGRAAEAGGDPPSRARWQRAASQAAAIWSSQSNVFAVARKLRAEATRFASLASGEGRGLLMAASNAARSGRKLTARLMKIALSKTGTDGSGARAGPAGKVAAVVALEGKW
jgi:hypothetical protein